MKLKTLKDLEILEKKRLKKLKLSSKAGVMIQPEELRQEAIKWIKNGTTEWILEGNGDGDEDIEIINKWIKHFFNITD